MLIHGRLSKPLRCHYATLPLGNLGGYDGIRTHIVLLDREAS